jgi:hypothetical protein
MRGRRPSGPEYVEHLAGSNFAKERAKVLLETVAGRCRVHEACKRLGISEPRLQQLRTQMLQAAVNSLEPGSVGRPSRSSTPEQEEIARLQQQLVDLQVELQASRARAEIALILPNVVQDDTLKDQDPEKKTRSRNKRRRGSRNRPPGPRKNT